MDTSSLDLNLGSTRIVVGMTSPSTNSGPRPLGSFAPNHHAHHPGFSGPSGLLAAVMFLGGRRRSADLAIELSGLQPGEHVVDVGCGPGVAVRRARSIGASAIGVDPAAVMLRVARLRWRSDDRIEWRIGTAEAIPVEDDWAHVVWSLSTVHHWADIDRGIIEARRVMCRDARLVVLERRIDDPGASGVASHGWTAEQARAFGARCHALGLVDVRVDEHPGSPNLVSVVAVDPGRSETPSRGD
jgi:SAM-dependent methyltransferase